MAGGYLPTWGWVRVERRTQSSVNSREKKTVSLGKLKAAIPQIPCCKESFTPKIHHGVIVVAKHPCMKLAWRLLKEKSY